LLALLLAGLVTVPVGAIVAIPAIRLSGVYLAVATFGFGILVQRIFFQTSVLFGHVGNRTATRPALPGIDLSSETAFYYVVLAIVVAGCVLVVAIHRSRLGRLLRTLAGSPLALETNGASTNLTKVLVFCISAFMAGIAGGLLASLARHINTFGFDAFNSLLWLAVLVIAGRGEILPAFIAGIALIVVPSYITSNTFQDYLPVLFGTSAVLVAARGHGSLAGDRFRQLMETSTGRASRSPARARSIAAHGRTAPEASA
jgi:ABC-type branched-subunit amino acid transport system permease subunit